MDFLMQITTYKWTEPAIPFGIGVFVICWLLWRTEPRLRAVERAIDRMNRTLLLFMLSLPKSSDVVKQKAGEIMHEIDEEHHKEDGK